MMRRLTLFTLLSFVSLTWIPNRLVAEDCVVQPGCLDNGPMAETGIVPAQYACMNPSPRESCGRWSTGFEFTLLQPRFEGNVAFTTMESDGASFETFDDTEFDYDLSLSPRLWLQYETAQGIGIRTQYWQFDHSAGPAAGSPPANGFGRVSHPTFGPVNISSTIPTDLFLAGSGLNAYTIDIEATKSTVQGCRKMMLTCGLRYASIEQDYNLQLRNAADTLRGEIDYHHRLSGIGPTLSFTVGRPVWGNLTAFGFVRGSLLYGDGDSRLVTGEDLDTGFPFTTTRETDREDLLPIGEMQLGLEWSSDHFNAWKPILRCAMEGQFWNGVGNSVSEQGDLGFFGFNTAIGVTF